VRAAEATEAAGWVAAATAAEVRRAAEATAVEVMATAAAG
jgi:hypothetical protein